jgi:hypothetical protein
MLKTIKPDANGAFPIINDDLDSKIIVVVDEYNEERLPVSYFLLENQSKVLYHIPSMNIVNFHINLCQTELRDYQNLFRILGSKYKPLWAITYFIIFDSIYEYMEWKARTIPGQR